MTAKDKKRRIKEAIFWLKRYECELVIAEEKRKIAEIDVERSKNEVEFYEQMQIEE